ncbi:hypothetical protein YH65_00110 [Sulfurovum lithotrophicum]|uniref:Exosortase/archaeosortase family protein n=1 Tax=Sulfurovum lithotrophicum TaxID=206403 RepID=A0A7U4LZF4_9BACT|nr:exosortase/archaeosortase family protein [Sulfurovum lithotrophicum]AKF23989.1 hypothetical protein YH65_00110 [Sulfurovum lithotrophicum]
MKRFIALYFLFLALLFVFLYLPTLPVSLYLNQMQSGLTLKLLSLFLKAGQLQGIDIMINPHYKIIINQACNGLIPFFFLAASILAYPTGLRHKTLWLIIGYLVYLPVNVARILMVVYFVESEGGRGNFHWSHDIVGNAILLIVGLGLFITFIRTDRLKRY